MKERIKERAVIEFLTAEDVAPVDAHRRMITVYGEVCVDRSNVRRWVRGSRTENRGTPSVHGKPYCGRP